MFKLWNESHEAFGKVYHRFSKPLRHYIRSRISDPEVAEELTQEVFLKAYRFRDSYEERYALSTWLWTIARNTIADHLRALRPEGSVCEPDELACERPCAESMLIHKDLRRGFVKALGRLTRMQKRVLWMRVIHQLSYEEISRKLGVSLSAVKNLAYRAKQTLSEASHVVKPILGGI